MTIKKIYDINDDAWIYGISRTNNKPIKGKVIFKFNLNIDGYDPSITYYIISIPTEIEPLLEVRSWEDISQDENGPIGLFRNINNGPSTTKKISKLGLFHFNDDPLEPSPEEIMKALEQSTEGLTHKPLFIKETKPKRKFYGKKSNYKPTK